MSIRNLLITLSLPLCLVACLSGNDKRANGVPDSVSIKSLKDTANFTTIEWIDSTKDFGKVKEGPKVDVTFRFRNTGAKPLVIADVRPGCGCTVVEQPTKPIMPGEESEIRGSFETKGHLGQNNKNIMVQANTQPRQQFELKFSVEVQK